MFSPRIVCSDAFLDMPTSSQALYLQLGMSADDDGFVNPKRIIRGMGASDDDLKVLLGKRFVLPFESGVVVIKHWKVNNQIRADRYNETIYLDEKKMLETKLNGSYTELRQPNGNQLVTQVRLGKDSLGKERETEKGETPSQKTKDFFLKGKVFTEYVTLYSVSVPRDTLLKELDKFILYWTESNGTGTKQRWQLQPTFDVKRRLYTWLEKMNSFTRTVKPRIVLS